MVFLHVQLSSVSHRAKADSCFILHSIPCIHCLRCNVFLLSVVFHPSKSLTAYKADSAFAAPGVSFMFGWNAEDTKPRKCHPPPDQSSDAMLALPC